MSLSSVFEIILRLTIIFLSDTIVLGGDILTVGERLRYLRKTKLGYKNCDDFGVRIGLSGSNIRNIETGRINLTDRVVSDICNVFSVNENWLRNGGDDKDIFLELNEDEELAMCTQMLIDSEVDDTIANMIKKFICIYEKLDTDSKKVLMNIADEMINNLKKSRADLMSAR